MRGACIGVGEQEIIAVRASINMEGARHCCPAAVIERSSHFSTFANTHLMMHMSVCSALFLFVAVCSLMPTWPARLLKQQQQVASCAMWAEWTWWKALLASAYETTQPTIHLRSWQAVKT